MGKSESIVASHSLPKGEHIAPLWLWATSSQCSHLCETLYDALRAMTSFFHPHIRRKDSIGLVFSSKPDVPTVHNVIFEKLGIDCLSVIGYQVMSRNRVIVRLGSRLTYERFVKEYEGKEIQVSDGITVKIVNMGATYSFVSVRYAPFEMDNSLIETVLSRYGKVHWIRNNQHTYGKANGLLNGIRTAKMEIKANIPSSIWIAGHTVAFMYSGQKRTCYKCGSEEHLLEQCSMEKTLREELNDKEVHFPQLGEKTNKEKEDQVENSPEQGNEENTETATEENNENAEGITDGRLDTENGLSPEDGLDVLSSANTENQVSGKNPNGRDGNDQMETETIVEIHHEQENSQLATVEVQKEEGSSKGNEEIPTTDDGIEKDIENGKDDSSKDMENRTDDMGTDTESAYGCKPKDTVIGLEDSSEDMVTDYYGMGKDQATEFYSYGNGRNIEYKDKTDIMTDDSLENVMIDEAIALEKQIGDQDNKEGETESRNIGKWKVHMENEVKMVISKSKDSGEKTHRDDENGKDCRERKRFKVNTKSTC